MAKRNLERLRVLIVDDNHHMINIVKTILRGFGVKEYYEARDAVEAFDLVRSESVDFVVVDKRAEYEVNFGVCDAGDFANIRK